jgi:hypothetical protein
MPQQLLWSHLKRILDDLLRGNILHVCQKSQRFVGKSNFFSGKSKLFWKNLTFIGKVYTVCHALPGAEFFDNPTNSAHKAIEKSHVHLQRFIGLLTYPNILKVLCHNCSQRCTGGIARYYTGKKAWLWSCTYLNSHLLGAPCEYVLHGLDPGLDWASFWPSAPRVFHVATPHSVFIHNSDFQ